MNFARIQKKIEELALDYKHVSNGLEKLENDLKVSQEILNTPFQYEDELKTMRTRQKEINDILNQENQTPVLPEDIEEQSVMSV